MLDGKIVLITGATRGIGKAIALTLGSAGAIIIGTATSEAGADNVSKMLDDKKILGKGAVLDVTNNDQILSLDENIKKEFDERIGEYEYDPYLNPGPPPLDYVD